MTTYQAPMPEMQFVLNELAGINAVTKLPGYEEATADVVAAILDEASKFATNVLDPINWSADQEGPRWSEGGVVTTPKGYKEAYKQFCENGWNGLTKPAHYGGQGLPQVLATAVEEMWHSSNLAFDLCPLLTQGAIEALELCGSDAIKEKFLHKMVAGTWAGTMNLTEPQAGSDLAAVRTKAVPQGDGTYKLYGQKIYITFGEHDLTENIIHLVLARTPDAPEGVKGISLFVVPKFMVNDDGSLGARNDVYCISIEHKLGIHGSPTATLAFGDKSGAIGYLVGQENRGLEYMFIMMNLARFSVGMEGVGISERSYQSAVAYARERVQGKALGTAKGAPAGPIIEHPDVARMLMTMRAYTEATRAVAYVTAAAMDHAARSADPAMKKRHQAFADLMIPIVKGFTTEIAQEVTYLGIQVHGGMGFSEETGVAQYYRDARILTIYEGTTGIQAGDLMGRKTARDGGAVALAVAGEIGKFAAELAADADPQLKTIGEHLAASVADLKKAVEWVAANFMSKIREANAGSVPYMRQWGLVVGCWQMARAAHIAARHLKAGTGDAKFMQAKIITARFYAEWLLPQAKGCLQTLVEGGAAAVALPVESF